MKQLILVIIIALFATTSYSQPYSSNSELKYTKAVTKELGRVDGYLEHLPPGYHNSTKKYPLIVYLHGTGERGNGSSDLYRIANVGCPSRRVEENGSLCFKVNGVDECFIVISPQLNPGQNWTAGNQEQFWVHVLEKAGYRIDKDRVYLTGHSLGGIGTWEAAYSDFNTPNRFAAIAPLSYKIGTSKVCNVADKKIPVWAFCGEDDSYLGSAKGAINTLKNCPGRDLSVEIKFTIVPDAGHSITGPTYRVNNSVYDPNVYEWLLTKKRGSVSSPTPSVPDTPGSLDVKAQNSSSILVTWSDNSSNEDGFTIQRSTSSGSGFSNAATLGAGEVLYTDTGLTPSTQYYYRMRAFNDAGNSAYTSQASATTLSTTTTSPSGGTTITWTNIHGAVQQGDDLESIAPSGWGNSGAGSSQSIASNADGWIEMVIEDPSKADLVFGLSDANVNDNIESTDYGFEFSKYNNAFWKRENSDRNYLGSYEVGDRLRIERSGSKIIYKRNGAVVATSDVSSRPALVADAALLNTGSTIFNGKISSSSSTSSQSLGEAYIQWVNINGALQQGSDLESTASYGWGNSGAGSSQSIPSNADGWIEMVIEDPSKADLVFGLSDANVNDNIESTDFGFELSKYNNAYWTRENSDRSYLGTFEAGDRLRIERSGSTIIYKKNGVMVSTTNLSSRPSLIADAALLNTGSTVFQGTISSSSLSSLSSIPSSGDGYIKWININGAVQQGNDLESIAPSGWGNSGAGSSQSIASNADGWIEMVIEDPSKADLVFGLSDVNGNDNKESIDYGFELSKYNNAYWTRENSDRNYLGSYDQGDELRIERSGDKIIYKKNGVPVSTTNISSRPSLVADVALLNTGSTVFQGKISSSSTSSAGRFVDEVIAGQTELSDEQEVLVYPNPIGEQGFLHIDLVGYEFEDETRLLLFNLTGVLVLDQTINSPSSEIALQNLPQATYIYRLIQGERQLKSGLLIR